MRVRLDRRSEQGTTLIELLVTVAIMGFSMLAILGGIGTSIIFADIQRKDATGRVVLTSAAEKILSEKDTDATDAIDDRGYVICATEASYKPPSSPGYKAAVTSVAFWDPDTNRFVASPDSCRPIAPDKPTDTGLQLITLSVTSARQGNGVQAAEVETIEVVKRQVEP